MNTNNIISSIINLPEKFYSLGNISIYSLLKETGYFEMYNQVDEINILNELVKKNRKLANKYMEQNMIRNYLKLHPNGFQTIK